MMGTVMLEGMLRKGNFQGKKKATPILLPSLLL